MTSHSQSAETIGTPWMGEPGVTVRVSEIMKVEKSRVRAPFAIQPPRREFEVDRHNLSQNPLAPAVSSWPPIPFDKQRILINSVLSPQTVSTSFFATNIGEGPGYMPPDVMGDVGPTQILIHVNGRIKVFNKNGTVGALNADGNVFWNSVRNSLDVSDPHVRYDRITKRWFLCIINTPSTGHNRILIAVSSDSVITSSASFTFFQFTQDAPTPVGSDANGFADYPTLGVDANAVYIAANIFNSTGTSFIGSTAFVINKASLLAGTLTVTVFRDICTGSTQGPYTPQGAHNDDPTAAEGYFIGVDALNYGQLDIRRVSNPGGTPTLSSDLIVSVPATTAPIVQVAKGSSATLDALEDRLFAAQVKKNKKTGTVSLWTAHNIEVNSSGVGTSGGGRNGSRWYEITNLTTTPTLRQAGTVYSSASSNPIGYWIPSVAMSGQGHMALGCSYASTNDYTSIAVAGRLSSDVLGTTQSVTNALVGSSTYNIESTSPQRWGDYTQTVIDPNDDMTMWTFQEYCDTTDSWGIRVLKLLAPPPATASSVSPASVNTGQTTSVVVTGASVSGSQFFDPGTGYTNRLAAVVNGGGVTLNSVTFTDSVHVTLNITVAGNATPGARSITVTNPDGQAVTSATGILTIVNPACSTITFSPSTLTNGAAGSAYSQLITASGGTAPYTFSLSSGSLPSGVTLASGGLLSGTPAFGGSYSFTIGVADSNGCPGSQAYTWTVTGCPQITLSPSTLPNGNIGVAYSQSFSTTGGTSPYTYSVTSGALPAGLSLASGVLSGTPTTVANYSFTITSTDANTCTASQAYSVNVVSCPTITLSSASLPSGTVNTAYSQTISASGGTAAYTYAVTSGTLPAGLSLSPAGALTGTPTTTGTSSFTITATDANTCTGSLAYSLTISVNVGNTVNLTTLGVASTQDFNTLAATGTTGSTKPTGWLFSETGGSADTTYGIGTGSNTAGNTYSFGATSASDRAFGGIQSGGVIPTIGAGFTNSTGGTITSLTISYTGEEWRVGANRATRDSILFALSTNATSLTTGSWTRYGGLDFVSPLVNTAAAAVDGNAPANRTAKSATITGLSIANGAAFYIRWTDFNISGADDGLAVDDFSITPNGSGGCPTITLSPATLPAGTNGTAYNQTLTSSGGTSPYIYTVTSGTLPTGLSLASGGTLSGTPLANGTFGFTVTATDSNSCTGSQVYSVTISAGGCPTITLSPSTLPGSTVGAAYSQTITASGGTPGYSYATTAGSLPIGLTLSSTGTLSGTPTVAGSYSFTITATDTNACTGSQAYSVTINAVSSSIISLTTAGSAYTQNFDSLASTGTSATVPFGWSFSESGTSANSTYTANNGTSNTGDTYSYGTTSSSERAFGGLHSGSVNPTIGAGFTNNTGTTITSLAISFAGEQWRLGLASRTAPDSLQFQLSTDASSLSTGTWTRYSSLDFLSPILSGTVGALDGNASANRTAVSATISGLSIANGTTFFVRWVDGDVTSSDDGLGVDDFSITPNGTLTPTNPSVVVAANPLTVAVDSTTLLTATVTPGTNPASTGITIVSDLTTVGGSPTQTMYDDGTHGDLTTGDNVFSYAETIPHATATGTKVVRVSVSDAQARTAKDSITLTVTIAGCPAIALSPTTLPSGSVGTTYNQVVTASGGKSPYTYAASGATLPAGITLASNGTLSGTSNAVSSTTFTVTATDSNGCQGSRQYTLQINCATLAITPSSLPNDTVGRAYNHVLTPSGGTAPYAFTLTSGSLPNGVALSLSGMLSGTTSLAGNFNFTITLTDTFGCSAVQPYSMSIVDTAVLVQIPVVARWNIISRPFPDGNDTVSVLYPGATSPAYSFTGSTYLPENILRYGSGYWLKFGATGSITFNGHANNSDTLSLITGWNLIGSLARNVPVSEILSHTTLVQSDFFGYSNGYLHVDTLKPGKGYWVKSSQNGQIVLQPPTVAKIAPVHKSGLKTKIQMQRNKAKTKADIKIAKKKSGTGKK